MIFLTKKEAVEKYGTKAQKEHFYENGEKFKDNRYEKSLIKTIKQYWESVENDEGGYKLEGKRKKPIEREDKRKEKNGKKVIYEYQFSSLVMNYIGKTCSNNTYMNLTLSKLLIEIRVITPDLAYCQFNKGKMAYHLQQLQKLNPTEFIDKDFVIINHFIKLELQRLKQNLGSILTKLVKKKIIKYKKKPMGCDLENKHRLLTSIEVKDIKKVKKELLSKHDLTQRDLFMDNVKVDKYFKELKQLLIHDFKIQYDYESHCIKLVDDLGKTKQRCAELVKTGELKLEYELSDIDVDKLIYQFKSLFGESSLKLARDRENKIYESEHEHIAFRKGDGMYTVLWEKMLKYFDLYDYLEENNWL
jgi:hypothetical protein